MTHTNGALSPEEIDVFQEDDSAPAVLTTQTVQRERLLLALDMVLLLERDLPARTGKRVRLLVSRVASDLGVLHLLHGKK